MGDKTRMNELARNPQAFVRACPTGGVLGGVARYTNDVVLLCQAASFDVVFIETVGLGQSEIMIDETSDMLLLIVPPGGGDELQGVKKGIVEVADVIVVNKADGQLLTQARHTAAEYKHALHFQVISLVSRTVMPPHAPKSHLPCNIPPPPPFLRDENGLNGHRL